MVRASSCSEMAWLTVSSHGVPLAAPVDPWLERSPCLFDQMCCLLARIQALLARVHSRAHDVSTGLYRRGTLHCMPQSRTSLDTLACIVLASCAIKQVLLPCMSAASTSKVL